MPNRALKGQNDRVGKEGVRIEGTTKVARIDEPISGKMILTTDENGRLKMLLLRARAMQHGDEVDSSANSNLQVPQAQLPLPQVDNPLPPPRPHRRSR